MGATLSKLWASLRDAWTGGAATAKNTQHQPANGQPKDLESGTQTPAPTTGSSANMSEVKKYEITEVCQMFVFELAEG